MAETDGRNRDEASQKGHRSLKHSIARRELVRIRPDGVQLLTDSLSLPTEYLSMYQEVAAPPNRTLLRYIPHHHVSLRIQHAKIIEPLSIATITKVPPYGVRSTEYNYGASTRMYLW